MWVLCFVTHVSHTSKSGATAHSVPVRPDPIIASGHTEYALFTQQQSLCNHAAELPETLYLPLCSVAQLSRLMSLWLKPSPGPTSRPEAAVPWRSLHLQHLDNQSCAPLANPQYNMKDNQALSWPLSLEGLSCCVLVFQQPNCCTAAPAEVSPASCWVRHLCLPGPSLTTQIKQPTKLSSYLSSAVSSASCRP